MPTKPRRRALPTAFVSNSEYARLEKIAAVEGRDVRDFILHVLAPALEAENGDELHWLLVGIDEFTYKRIAGFCREESTGVAALCDDFIAEGADMLLGATGTVA